MTDRRKLLVARALLTVLNDVGDRLLREEHLFAHADAAVDELLLSEFNEVLKFAELRGWVLAVAQDFGKPKWKITDQGRARLAEF